MGWITKEDGQHIYIGAGGEFQPRGPTAPKGAANRASGKGPGGMARTASGINLHERMTASATAASTRAAAARARGDRTGELQAHEHRALILAKQNDIKGVHKSQFGYERTAPAGEKTAAAALVARVRGGGKAAAPAAPARPAAPSLREQAATGLPHPSTLLGSSASAGDYAGAARSLAAAKAGVQASRASATAAQSRDRFARGEHDAAGVYREGAKVVVTGTKTITNPITGKGKVTVPTGVVKIGDRTSKIGDQQAMHLAGKLPRASTDPGERSARAAQLLASRAGRAAPAAPARPAAPSLREQAATARETKITDVMTRSAMTDRIRSNGLTGVTDAQKRVVRAVDLKTLNAGRLTAAIRQKDKPAIARYKAREASLGGLVRNLQGKAK